MRLPSIIRVVALTALAAALCGTGAASSASAEVISFEAQYREVPDGPSDEAPLSGSILFVPQGDDFLIRNTSDFAAQITQITIDLSTTTVAAVFDTANFGGGTNPAFAFSTSSVDPSATTVTVADGGTTLVIDFGSFDAGEDFTFSIDVDNTTPTGIGEPTLQRREVTGAEFEGATIQVVFSWPFVGSPQTVGATFLEGALDSQLPDQDQYASASNSATVVLQQEPGPAPVPEPTSLALWAVGGLGMAFAARRRRARASRKEA